MPQEINCAEACVNGCVLGDQCPNLEYKAQASQFIENTSLDKILEMAEESVRKKMLERASQPPQWILPED
jgi:iron only hydrogenase large subunit-like protein